MEWQAKVTGVECQVSLVKLRPSWRPVLNALSASSRTRNGITSNK
jgi:hypothetical protein